MPRLPTGVPGFDAMVQGGLPFGSSVVLQGPPGQEKLRFALIFLAEGLRSGGSGLVVTSSQSPDAVLAELRELGVNLDSVTNENRLRVVDWYSWSEETVQDIEDRGIVIRSSNDLTNLGVALSRAIAGLTGDGSRRAVIELLSPATSSYEVTQVYAFAQSAKRKFDRHQFTSLVLLEKEMHSGAQLTTLHQPFDGVIEIERTRSGDRIVRKIGVLHLKDTAPDPTFRVLDVSERGMRVVLDTPKPAAPGSTTRGTVLESQDERAQRLRLILQIATERLKLNSGDADALFAMAAAQATLDDAKGGLETLERLAALDSAYPGLWVLKTKLHAKLGQADLARQSRMRAQQSEPEAAKAIDATVPCPMCEEPIALDATSCANCGVKFTPTRSMEDELDDLGHAAIQEMVQEELGPVKGPEKALDKPDVRAPKPGTERDVPPAKKPIEKTPSKKGLTNGLALGRRGASKAGRTNGLRGRTNGLRGRTNGLTNGLGRTNGLTNGLGRTNGLTNGLGRTNGLTNGLGRTNGLTNGLGRTNGLTNGLGRTNGLTNGLGGFRSSGFRPAGVRRMMQNAGWKLYLIPLVSAALLLAPLFFVPDYRGPAYPIQIDGQFGDWASQPTEAMGPGATLNPNIDVVRFGVVNNLGPYAFYVQVAGSALAGGGPSPGTMDTMRIFVDIDASAATGYRIDGLGADRMIEVSGRNGTVLSSTLWEFDSNRNQQDWNGWIKGTATPAAASGSRIETEAQWLAGVSASIPIIATVHTVSWDGQTDTGDFPLSPGLGILSAVADPQTPDVIAGNGVALLRLVLVARSQPVALNSVRVEIAGTAPANASSLLQLTDGTNVLAQVAPTSRDVTFSFAPRQLAVGGSTTLTVVGDFASTTGETFGVRLPAVHPFGLGATVVSLRENPGARMLGYLGLVPSTPRVDGAFDEWNALSSDTTNDVAPRSNPDIDLGRYGAHRNGTSTFLYADVTGRLFHGTPVPEHPQPVPAQSQGPADTDRDGVPDAVDPFPFDFNNDGVPDAQTNGDYDGDGIADYGFPGGTDYW
ncbi:MAG TPA: ATPase domain-containing protein, partial [Thermoplasmata archaeon]|nr:ATPase domain-containing protein [Thermoplasmata archaeon]